MTSDNLDPAAVDAFIARWAAADGTERANYQLFALDLCELLGVQKPNPASRADGGNAYVFERNVTASFSDGSRAARFIDLYKRACFVLEAKQSGKKLDSKGQTRTLQQAWAQAEQYARSLPAEEGRPPFILVVDVGRTIDLYAEFSRSGATYTAFPDANSNRITLPDLHKPEVQDRLRRLWTDPHSLDPANYSAKVTRKISNKLAELAKSLEQSGHKSEAVAGFLSRCLFTMFAEDVELLPSNSFRDLLQKRANEPDKAMNQTRALWRDMNTGTDYSAAIETRVLRFNGGLFQDADVLPLDKAQLAMLIDAAKADWRYVEPAIFGTLLERALSPGERHKLGAHYTPRAYVERLVLPTVIEPLREEWKDIQAAAALKAQGKGAKARNEAAALLKGFQHRLSTVRVLDPACGSGNFLYVTLDHMKRLEAEVLAEMDKLGQATLEAEGLTVSPHQFLGIEINPRAARLAELVLWIGYLQWHYRTFKHLNLPEPVLRDFKNIENRDAVLAYDAVEEVLAPDGVPVTGWDGKTLKPSPVTGELIPDESARAPLMRYVKPRKATWPEADFIVGNPPYLGARRIRLALGDGYLDALRNAWSDIPEHADFVMYWWAHAANLVADGCVQRFGLITSNSIRQSFSRKVLDGAFESHPNLSLRYVIPDHPWVDTADGAAVRVAMTVVGADGKQGRLQNVAVEREGADGEIGVELETTTGFITANLSVGVDPNSAVALLANKGMACVGYQLTGQGFVVDAAQIEAFASDEMPLPIRPLVTGRDLMQRPRNLFSIDLLGFEIEDVRTRFPVIYQRVLDRVKPERDQNRDGPSRENWWLFARPRAEFRPALVGIEHAIVTSLTAKHRTFIRVPAQTICDSTTVMFAFDDALQLGVLSSTIHVTWALAAGGRLGVGNDPRYNKSRCFETFPFPIATDELAERIRILAEQLDAHRKRQQATHPNLTLTGMYNVLEKMRSGEALNAKEKITHEQGLVSVLKQLHDDLDTAVLEAYGWADLKPGTADFIETILTRLVALNAQRAAEEVAGTIRWLRPEFQNPVTATATPAPEQATLDVETEGDEQPAATPVVAKQQAWPSAMAAQFKAVRLILASGAQTSITLAAQFKGKSRQADITDILDTLETLGQVMHTEDSRYALI